MTTMLLVLVPLILLAMLAAGVLAAIDSAHLAISRAALARALADRPEPVRRLVRAHHTDSARTLAAVALARLLAETVLVAAIAAGTFRYLAGWVLPTVVTVAVSAVLMGVVLAVSPRTIGRRRPESVLIGTRTLIRVVRALLWLPAGALMSLGAGISARPGTGEDEADSAADARRNVDRALENEHVHDGERDMIQGVFDLSGTMVRELMVPRTDMVTISADATADKAMRLFVRSGFSRVPVIGESVDDLCGMLYVKDVMRTIHSPWDPRPQRTVDEIMRPARFVPEFVAADEVLRQMQTSRVHIAIAIDEYGGVAGILTIEDVVESIVGDIADEHDPAEPEIEQLDPDTYRVPARAGLSDVGELFDLDIDDDDVDSIGGLLGKALGRVPIVGSGADVQGLHLEAEKTAGRRKRLSTIVASRRPRARADTDPGEQEDDHER